MQVAFSIASPPKMINRPRSNIRRKENFHSAFQGEIVPLCDSRLNFDLLRVSCARQEQQIETDKERQRERGGKREREREIDSLRAEKGKSSCARVAVGWQDTEREKRDEAYESGHNVALACTA